MRKLAKVLPLLGCALFKQLLILFSQLENFSRCLWSGLVWSAGECDTVIFPSLSLSLTFLVSSILLSAAQRFKVSNDNLILSPTPPTLSVSVLHLLLLLLAMFNTP